MKNKKITAAVCGLAAAAVTAVSASAECNFGYWYSVVNKDMIIACDGLYENDSGNAAKLYYAVYYNNGKLLTVQERDIEEGVTRYNPGIEYILKGVKGLTDISVKIFVWSADGKLVPYSDVYEATESYRDWFDCSDLATDTICGTKYVSYGTLPVEGGLSYDIDSSTKLYVNGMLAGNATDDNIERYILGSTGGSVTIADYNMDGIYDCIYTDYYVDAVVESVNVGSAYATIYLKDYNQCEFGANYIRLKLSDIDKNVTILRNNKAASYTDLCEGDVISIAYDVLNNPTPENPGYCEILACSDSVYGTVTGRDTVKNTVNVDGNTYNVTKNYDVGMDFYLNAEFGCYLNSFGKIAYAKAIASNGGLIVAMYKSAGNTYQTVRLVTDAAEMVAYECASNEEAKKFWELAVPGTAWTADGSFTKSDVKDNIQNCYCTYSLGNGKISFGSSCSGFGGEKLIYDAASNKLGDYYLSYGAVILDFSDYYSSSGSAINTIPVYDLEDGAEYTAYMYNANTLGEYRTVALFEFDRVKSYDSMAVAEKILGITDVDGIECTVVQIAKDGEDGISLIVEGTNPPLIEGTVFAYAIGAEGYVHSENLYAIYSPESSYAATYTDALENMSGALENMTDTGKGYVTPAYGMTTIKEVELYYGVVYSKSGSNLKLITNTSGTGDLRTSNVNNDIVSFSLSGANAYIHDYGQKSGYRVSVGSLTQNSTIFNQSYTDSAKSIISWKLASENQCNPELAIVKVVDGDVIDVFYYIAP
ncbi:MAG: hypothetical protein ACI4DP_05305 [Candidatus Ornithomonoglobus sp.]